VFPNKFTFVSFKGKSHDKDVKIDEKKKLAKLTKIKKEEEELEEKEKDPDNLRKLSDEY